MTRTAALTIAGFLLLFLSTCYLSGIVDDTYLFMKRSQCGRWGNWAIPYQIANGVIAVSYTVIPLELYRRSRTVENLGSKLAAAMFIGFIMLCGWGHIVDGILLFYWPNYKVATLWHISTAVVSVTTAIAMPGIVISLLKE